MKIKFCRGTNLYDFFITPAIRINRNAGFYAYITIDWLKWYIGISWQDVTKLRRVSNGSIKR